MDRITATACNSDNRNRDAVVNMTTATAVIFSTTANILRNFYTISYFMYVKVQIVIMSLQLTIFFCNRALNGIYGLILILKFVILKLL